MAALTHDISAPSMMQNITLHVRVTGLKVLRARLWLGSKLLVLAAHVMGCGIDIEMDNGSKTDGR